MEHFLVALDGNEASRKVTGYIGRILKGIPHVQLTLFHVLPMVSPNFLGEDRVRRIEKIQEENEHLSGYFWSEEDEEKMNRCFEEACRWLLDAGFVPGQIRSRFSVESTEVARVILKEAQSLGCTTVVMGRRGLGRVKEFFLGSVSSTVTKQARGFTVWVVDD